MSDVLWQPNAQQVAHSQMAKLANAVGQPVDYDSLYAWSVAEPAAFWSAVWDRVGILGTKGARVLVDGEKMPGARWFPDAQLSFAENLLRRTDDAPAIIFRGEGDRRREVSFAELRREVARLQRGLRKLGLTSGDRVAAFVPNVPEVVVAMLAVSSLGGIWSSCSPDFGEQGVLDRFGQLEPRFLFAADGYFYKGKRHDSREKLRGIQNGLPTLERTIVIPFIEGAPDLGGLAGTMPYSDLLGDGEAEPEFPRFGFDHALYILFSSGTTGKPKCIVHGAGGTLIQHLKEHQLHTDLRPNERLFYFTTTGWMMWNWLVTGLASGATIVLYDGNPFHPGPEALWNMAAQEGVSVFGTSAKFIDAVKKAGLVPAKHFDLSKLRAVLSTGSPLVAESFDFVYEGIKQDLLLGSIAGGTDIISCFVLGCPIRPVRRGEIQCRGLGMQVEVFGADGNPVRGRAGELVCTAPFPSMPVGFWHDPNGDKYRSAYFDHYPGVWRHGDWAALTEYDGMIIYGRSDATLNPGGVRIGSAEIYRQVEQIDVVEESVVVGQQWQGDQRIVLFVRLRADAELDDALQDAIRKRIRANTTPRHVPAKILSVTDIPRTRSGKISEIAIREVVHGREVNNVSALANPEALEQYRNRRELA